MKKLPRLPRPGKPQTLAVKHKRRSPTAPQETLRSSIKGSRPASNSSHVVATSYDPELGQLDVTFTGGRKYRYSGVSKEIGSGIAGADSLGRYLHAHVIGKHDVTKI